MGGPKALVEIDGVPLVRRAIDVLSAGGVTPVVVVLGAAAEQVRAALPPGCTAVTAADWAEGMGASLRAGLDAAATLSPRPDAVLVHLVDLPGVTAAAVARLAGAVEGPASLLRAGYDGRPAHPVVLGRGHWAAVRASATGDAGARHHLAGHPDLRLVECGDVAVPDDVDTPEQLRRFTPDHPHP
jgi:CTP:molybdopterin cytidylyltransferase MocA